MAYQRYHGVETRIVRIFNTYGPRMRLDDGRALPAFMGQALRGEPITVFGDGSQTRSFTYVDDLVEGIYRLLMSDEGEPTNVGNPQEVSIREFAQEVVALTGSASTLTFQDLPLDDPKVRQPDITKAQRVLGWEPTVDRADGLPAHAGLLPGARRGGGRGVTLCRVGRRRRHPAVGGNPHGLHSPPSAPPDVGALPTLRDRCLRRPTPSPPSTSWTSPAPRRWTGDAPSCHSSARNSRTARPGWPGPRRTPRR